MYPKRYQIKIILILIIISSHNATGIMFDRDLTCASGISSIPPFDQLTFLPNDRFPQVVPSGVNLCDWSCGGKSSKCTYNWAESMESFPFMLFRCWCPSPGVCPQTQNRYAGYININCQDVTGNKSRCICPSNKKAFQCNILAFPVTSQNPYYCVCCDAKKTNSM